MQWNTVFVLITHPFVFSFSISFGAGSSQVTERGRVHQSPRQVAGTKTIDRSRTLTAAEGGLSCF